MALGSESLFNGLCEACLCQSVCIKGETAEPYAFIPIVC